MPEARESRAFGFDRWIHELHGIAWQRAGSLYCHESTDGGLQRPRMAITL